MPSSKANQLRQKAEKLLQERGQVEDFRKYAHKLERLIEEFNDYQIELDLQNEELRKAEESHRVDKQNHEFQAINEELRQSNEELEDLNVKLQKSEKRYRLLFEESTDPCLILQGDQFVEANQAALDFLGYEDHDMIVGKKPWEISPARQADGEDSQNKAKDYIREAMNKGYHRFKWVHFDKNNNERWIDVSLTYLPTSHNKNFYTIWRDITDVKRSEELIQIKNEEIATQNEELETIFNMSLHMICIADIDTATFTKVNPAFTEILGYSEKELLGKSFMNFIHPDDVEPTQRIIDEDLKKGKKIFRFENRYVCKDGTVRWLDWVSHPDPDLGITFAVATNITERRNAENALKESEERFRNIIESTPMGTLTYELRENDRLIFTGYNEAGNAMLETDCKRFIGKTIEEAFPGLTKTKVPGIYREIARTGRSWFTDQIDYDHEGIKGAFEVYAFQTSPMNIAVMFLEITEKLEALRHIKESEEKFRTLVEQDADALLFHDLKGNLINVNQAAVDQYKYSRSELLNMKIRDLDPDYDEREDRGRFFVEMEFGKPRRFEARQKRKTGEVFPAEVTITKIKLRDKSYIMGLCRDISKEKAAKKALIESKELYKSLVIASPDAITFSNLQGEIEFVSPNMEKVLETNQEEITGTHLYDWIDIGDQYLAKRNVNSIMKGKLPGINRYHMKNAKNNAFIGEVVSSAVKNYEGEIIGMVSILRDVTKDIEIRNELDKHRQHLEDLVKERTAEIEDKRKEVERMNKLFVGREIRIKELREKVKELEKKLQE